MTDIALSLDPAWPWSLSGWGLGAFVVVALLLVALTLWTYVGSPGFRPGRVAVVLLLRLLALLVAFAVVTRPSVAVRHIEGLEPSKLLLLVDRSQSMETTDDFNGLSRWDNARRIVGSSRVEDALERLARDQRIEVVRYQGAEDVKPYDASGQADGKRTDVGGWLHELWQRHQHDGALRGLVILSDGADNGTRYPALELARRDWRGHCPIYTFGHGNPDDARERRDIAVTGLQVTPTPVPIKTRMSVKAIVQAPGYEGAGVEVSVWLEDSAGHPPLLAGEVQERVLRSAKDNEIVIDVDAPEQPDEYKLTFKVKPLPDEASQTNNAMSTFVPVTKEGVSVLWVEAKKRAYEPTFAIRYALGPERRFRVYYTEPPGPGQTQTAADWYQLDKRHYDVIVIGDISAAQFAAGDPSVFAKIKTLIQDKKTGLLMLGGYDTFAKGGWEKTALAGILPVTMDREGQLEERVTMKPTPEGASFPFLRLLPESKQNEALWRQSFEPLDGLTYLGKPAVGATVLAVADKEPILVASQAGGGRLLAFGGDTTWRSWRVLDHPETLSAYDRFWRQIVLWLAHQDVGGGNLWIDLERRRLLADGRDSVGFTYGLRGKTGIDIADAEFSLEVKGPGGASCKVAGGKEGRDFRGRLSDATTPGEYRLIIHGKGKDVDGSEVHDEKSARFMVEVEDVETLNTTADHEFLRRLAQESGGRFARADEQLLLQFLEELKGQARQQSRVQVDHWPDWTRQPSSDRWGDQLTALWKSSALLCFVLFVGCLGGEWGLRRLWGWV